MQRFLLSPWKRGDIGFATLGLHDTSFFLRRLAIFSSLLLNLFFYLGKIIEYWNCFQMHNKKAVEIWQRYSVDNYHYLWLGIKSLFPFYIIEYWIIFLDKKRRSLKQKVAWHKKISFWCHTTSTPSKSQNKIIKLQATYTSKILDVLKYNIVCLLLFLFYSFWEEKVWAIDF